MNGERSDAAVGDKSLRKSLLWFPRRRFSEVEVFWVGKRMAGGVSNASGEFESGVVVDFSGVSVYFSVLFITEAVTRSCVFRRRRCGTERKVHSFPWPSQSLPT